jgi:TrmH family RNA methyltransferase
MISKNRIKFILSLQKKKIRDEKRFYVIEGDKMVKEYLLSGQVLHLLVAKPEFIASLSREEKSMIEDSEPSTYEELKKISTLKTPHNAIAIVPIPEYRTEPCEIFKDLAVALEFVQDPGNFGTIIRAAAWFGIKHIVCSENCVDVYNPKVIQASMGALLNVKVIYTDLALFLAEALKEKQTIYGMVLSGDSIYDSSLNRKGIILLGNESKGISGNLIQFVTKRLSIPKFTEAGAGVDSLNVGMAASIVFSEFARKKYQSDL